jgi:hypothetical protein
MRYAIALILASIAAGPASGSSFGERYPAGSIKERAQAKAALHDATAEQARIDREFKARDAECLKGFLVSRCRDQVRRDKLADERELRRVRVEAHDLTRKLDAEDAAKRRAETAAKSAQPPRDAARPAEPKGGHTITPEEAARNRAQSEARAAEHAKREAERNAKAPERAKNAQEYADKQAEAARRAEENAAQREKTEQRRAERRKQMETQEAQREEVRRKAEEAAGPAGK